VTYAQTTSVSVEKTEAGIKSTLRRYGATSFGSFESGTHAMIAFEMEKRRIVFKLPLPSRTDRKFTHVRRGNAGYETQRTAEGALAAWEQACRARWRSLLLCIKAKLESVEAGIETFEDAFLAHIQMPDGQTVGEHIKPRIAQAYQSGSMPPLLLGSSELQP
jgi:hypothetical protein